MHPSTDDIGYQANRLARALRTSLAREVATLGITPRQAPVLMMLSAENELPMGGIAEGLGIDRPTLTGIVDRLERDGLIEQRVNPNDRRSRLISLTERGHTLSPSLAEASRASAEPVLAAMDAEDIAVLLELLDRAATAVEFHSGVQPLRSDDDTEV